MPLPPLPENIAAFLALPNPAVMATISPGGGPVTVATWYLFEDDGTILVGLDAGRARLEHLRRDPRVSLTVLEKDNWYTHVSVQGTIVSIVEDTGLAQIDRLSSHYTGKEYPDRSRPRVAAHLTIERWHGWGNMKP